MPPPTAVDPWLTARRFGVVIDAGSSGSRLQIYSWKDARSMDRGDALSTLPKVEKGTREGEEWSMKVEPGISSFAENPERVATYLAPLIDHARSHIPPSLQPDTPIFLLATAGMRLLSSSQQANVLTATCDYLRGHSNFRIDGPSNVGPCGSSVRIITGEEEGLFGWIAVNYLMDGFTGPGQDRLTYGFLDMGGASTQIAFEPSKEQRENAQNLIDVRLRLLSGREVHHQVFVTTWLGYGTNQARERYVGTAITEYEANRPPNTTSAEETVLDPCLPKDLRLTESPVQPDSSNAHSRTPHTLLGTGSFEQCLQRTLPLLNKDAPCPDTHCLFNGVYVPPIDFSASHFIGVSEYWYSSEHVFGLGGPYDVVQYERAASEFCSREWADILRQHELSRQAETDSRDGQVEHDGQMMDAGKWGDNVEIPRLQLQCFKAAWIVNVLHEGIGMPRIVDPGGNSTGSGDKVAQQAENKGLGRPTFQSMDSVGDIAISWTLGKMVLEASKEVPPRFITDRPIVDPLDDPPNTVDSRIRPIRPFLNFDAIEDRISAHLPQSMTRHSLGFSPVAFVFYGIILAVLSVVVYRLRYRLRSASRRFLYKRDRKFTLESYSMEEGVALNEGARSPGPWSASPTRMSFQLSRSLRNVSKLGSRPVPAISVNSYDSPPRSGQISPSRKSPLRSFSYPMSRSPSQNGTTALDATNGAATAFVPGSPRLSDGNIVSNGSLSSLTSRSRNSSQMNLSSLTPRQMTRTSSGTHPPIGSLFLG
ncbi:hypothetical protein WOLCODRAFT_114464 [Wolfiporia cocos MD-104 SS10]|uniref:Nucleoside phosphatase GDA1/CD39 n=1 Tax=Wolfiporia cocos (strain MD-104) TaxID=742152 RepID=A0A2H3JDN3_WOLCO|nr:hypothetical protein WOLCODRAFT_114464 [Wolfiporia cocos MD-104 SS10]